MKHAGHICGIALITVAFVSLVFAQLWFLDVNQPELSGVTPEQWMASFQRWAFICVASAGLASLLWYVLAQWAFKINRWENAGKRSIWISLFLLPTIAIVVSIIFVERAESGLRFEQYVFFLINGLLSYYFSTLLFSPSAFKYTPTGAKYVRHWW